MRQPESWFCEWKPGMGTGAAGLHDSSLTPLLEAIAPGGVRCVSRAQRHRSSACHSGILHMLPEFQQCA